MTADRDLHDPSPPPADPLLARLADGADLDPARRRALVDRIAPAPEASARPSAGSPSRAFAAWWIGCGLAAAAALILAAGPLRPSRPEPIRPTALLAGLLGPLPAFAEAAPGPAPAAKTGADADPVVRALGAAWGDLEGPLALVQTALSAPRYLAPDEPAADRSPAPAGRRSDGPSRGKEM